MVPKMRRKSVSDGCGMKWIEVRVERLGSGIGLGEMVGVNPTKTNLLK